MKVVIMVWRTRRNESGVCDAEADKRNVSGADEGSGSDGGGGDNGIGGGDGNTYLGFSSSELMYRHSLIT
jgi:hypothetical protein